MNPLITASDAAEEILRNPAVRVLDCRATLGEPGAGLAAWADGHIQSAMHADLDTELSMPGAPTAGRHPLPDDAHFSRTMSRWGVTPETLLIAYDAGDGAYAARAWWLATRTGHARTRIIDGGLRAWQRAGLPMQIGHSPPSITPTNRVLAFDRSATIDADGLAELLADDAVVLLDARARERFLGEVEPIDPMAGHIPGAHNRPYANNLDDGIFKSPARLREEFEDLIGEFAASDVVHMCGSGVTACHNLLAMEVAGLHGSRLFAPSWSGWIANPDRPIAMGGDSQKTLAL